MITLTALLFDPQASVDAGYRILLLKVLNRCKTHAGMVLWQIIGTEFQLLGVRKKPTTSTVSYHGSTEGADHLMMSVGLRIRCHHERSPLCVF